MSTSNSDEEAIFQTARRMSVRETRNSYVKHACGNDPKLKARIEALLRIHDEDQSFLESPTAGFETTNEQSIIEGPGTVVGPYRISEQIGQGGFGVVFMAEQQQPVRRQVALKVIKPGMDTRQVIARFEAERQALALMDHPHIAHILDGGETASGRPFFVMELVRGVPITEFCDRNHLVVRERLELFVSVCQAVQHAHQKGIIHRDLKPTNVLVTRHDGVPVVKVIDFGIAKAMGQRLTEKTLFTDFAQMVGTPLYMSPEQMDMSGLDIDTRADIYALGVLLYEMLTGTTPFQREQFGTVAFDEIRRIIREEEPAKPSTRISALGDTAANVTANRQSDPRRLSRLLRGELDWIVMKCLEKDRVRRYETANGLARDIQSYLNEEPVEAGPPSAGYRLRKLAHKHRKLLGTTGVFALLVALGLVASIWQAVRATQAEQASGRERDKAIVEKERADEQAAIAKAVSDFLQQDLLGQADVAEQAVGGERNRNITVREVLDRATREIDAKFPGQELTEAAIRRTLGKAYGALGEYPEAQKHLERALALRITKLGASHSDTLQSMHDLAVLHWARGRYDQAEALYRQVLQVQGVETGAVRPSTLQDLSNLTLQCINNLGLLHAMRGRHREAEDLYRQVLDTRRAKLGADHPDTLGSMNNLAALYRDHGRFDEAQPLFEQVLQSRRTKLGADHPDTLGSMANLAILYTNRGRFDDAEALHKEALEHWHAARGADHPHTLQCMANLAALYTLRDRFDDAETLFKQALEGWRARQMADHPNTLLSMANLATLYTGRGRYDEAEPLLREAVAAAKKKLGPGHPLTQTVVNELADLHGKQGQPQLGEPLLRELAAFLRDQAGSDSLAYASQLASLAHNLLEQKKYAEAEPVARDCLAIQTAKEPDAWTTFHAQSLLGGALLGRAKHVDAETRLLQGYEGMKAREATIPSDSRSCLIQSLERLAELYETWGKETEAARWQKELAGEKARYKK